VKLGFYDGRVVLDERNEDCSEVYREADFVDALIESTEPWKTTA
jgi:hypothetical protein